MFLLAIQTVNLNEPLTFFKSSLLKLLVPNDRYKSKQTSVKTNLFSSKKMFGKKLSCAKLLSYNRNSTIPKKLPKMKLLY